MRWLQQWTDVLFVHVPVAPAELVGWLPPGLDVDTYEGQAFLGLVGFRLKLRPSGLPFVPGLSSLLELNVRTYVRRHDAAGIVFLRMYADNRLAVTAAKLLTPLCYESAGMKAVSSASGQRQFVCKPARSNQVFDVVYAIAGPHQQPEPGSRSAWLVERYRLFVNTSGGLIAADVAHPPWQISDVKVHSLRQTLTEDIASASGQCLVHHSPGVAATFQAFRPVEVVRERCGLLGAPRLTRARVWGRRLSGSA